MQETATKKITKNAGISIICKILILGFAFIDRYLFIKILGEQFLGINGLYSNILSVLSLADLGINTVLMFFLYEPLVKKDEQQLCSLITFFKKIYRIIACSVFLLGICLIPFLRYLVNGVDLTQKELIGYYLLFLINTSCSYLAVYKTTILVADQKGYINNTINLIINISKCILQILILYFTGSYFLYLFSVILCTLLNNVWLTFISIKHYPYLKNKQPFTHLSEFKNKIISSIRDVFLYRIGATIINSTDNILISVLVGTAAVGYYSNYSLITINLTSLLMIFSQAVMTAIGNFAVSADNNRKEIVFRSVMLIYAVIASFVASCILCMMNDFIFIWIKDSHYVLSNFFVLCLSIKIFIDIITSPNWMLREAVGLFKEVRIIMVYAAIVNLIVSVILGLIWGVAGIILATAIAKLSTLFWFEPKTFYKKVFIKPIITYWKYELFLLAICMVCITLSYFVCNLLKHSIIDMGLKIVICGFITMLSFILCCRKFEEFNFIISRIKNNKA